MSERPFAQILEIVRLVAVTLAKDNQSWHGIDLRCAVDPADHITLRDVRYVMVVSTGTVS